MYKTFIVDEKQIDNILKEHEEWRITCLKVF